MLKPLEKRDVSQSYVEWLNDSQVNSSLETSYQAQTIESVSRYVENESGSTNSSLFGIWLRRTHSHIGNIRLGGIQWVHRRAEISLFIGDKTCWGQGYGTEAISLVSDWAFVRLGLMKIGAGVAATNPSCRRAFEKAGFVLEGTQASEIWIDGERTDRWIMGLTYKSWQRLYANNSDRTS